MDLVDVVAEVQSSTLRFLYGMETSPFIWSINKMTINHTDYILFGIAKLKKYQQNQKKRSSYSCIQNLSAENTLELRFYSQIYFPDLRNKIKDCLAHTLKKPFYV